MSFELNILGAVEARQEGREIPLGPPQRRAVLALLAAAPGHSLSVAELSAGLWDDSAPSTAVTAIQVHLHHLRKALAGADDGSGGPLLITRRSPVAAAVRYELQIAPGVVDIERYRAMQQRGAAARERGDQRGEQAARVVAEALWRGEPLTGLPDTALVRAFRRDLVREQWPSWRDAPVAGAPTTGQGGTPITVDGAQRPQMYRSDRPVQPARSSAARVRQGHSSYEPPPDSKLRFAVLGPVRAWRGDEPIGIGTQQQKALLAALLLRGGRTATAAELVDAVWGEAPPNTALAALRSYAFRLRKALGAGALVTDSGGYALHVETDCLDHAVAERLAAEADKARVSDPEHARELLTRALQLWHGEPLAGLPGPYAETQRTRLGEWRLGMLETRLELDLELGAHAEAVSELTALSAEHPLRERLRYLLMLALYRSGRQAESLGVYADTRRLLADDLGIDPSPELSELHQRILEADPALAAPPPDVPGRAEITRPTLLPAPAADFTGRHAVAREIWDQLAQASMDRPVMAVTSVAGLAGAGKTALAVHVAHAAREQFPDGQLYMDLKGTDPRPAEPEAVLGTFLRVLGVPAHEIPETLAERVARYRMTLDGRRVLVVLDNAYDAAQIRPLLPGTPGCGALVTSRVRMVDLAGAHLVDLDVMSPEEALQLFTRIVGEERVASERQAALDVVRACGFLPLAIRIVAARLAARRTWTVSVLAGKLADNRRRLDELRAGDIAVRSAFILGYGRLSPAQARAFRLLSLPDGPDISLEAAAAVLDLDAYAAEELLEALVDISLIESAAPARYRFHDLLRLYARECAERDETPEERCAALSRLLDFYLASAAGAYELENPGDRVLEHLAPTARPGLSFTTREKALNWLFSEAQGLLAAVEQAAGGGCEGPSRRAVDLLLAAWDLMESGIYARQYEQAARALVTAAHDCADALVEGRARVLVAQLLRMTGRFTESDEEARRAVGLGQATADPVTCSYALNVRGLVAYKDRRYQECADFHAAARDAFRADRNRHGEASALANLSWAQMALGEPETAVATARHVLALRRELNSQRGLGQGLYTLSVPLTATGRIEEALACLTEAVAIFRETRQRFWEAMAFYRIAEVQLAAKRWQESAAHAEQALALLREVGGEWRTANALTVFGRALAGMGEPDRAEACWHDALGTYIALGSPEAQDVQGLLSPDPPA